MKVGTEWHFIGEGRGRFRLWRADLYPGDMALTTLVAESPFGAWDEAISDLVANAAPLEYQAAVLRQQNKPKLVE